MSDDCTTAIIERYLIDLAREAPNDAVVRALLDRAVGRLRGLCASILRGQFTRLTRPPLNLDADELLASVVERLLKAMREYRPQTVRQFYALANQHMRWELNDLARRLDQQPRVVELRDGMVPAAQSSGSALGPDARRIFEAIESLPDGEREVFGLIHIQGLSHAEAAEVIAASTKTVQRRLNRSLLLLARQLDDLRPDGDPPPG
ncbi:RNA polymerase sigma factor [Singulisphaera sp. PoT]|uniref:RNA polymerase sigma factor n=1 Tax=Singulisphaera sp. PoT TaxID=3411797 RepID=UPI003BF4F9D2